jgi:hypothetical protein
MMIDYRASSTEDFEVNKIAKQEYPLSPRHLVCTYLEDMTKE